MEEILAHSRCLLGSFVIQELPKFLPKRTRTYSVMSSVLTWCSTSSTGCRLVRGSGVQHVAVGIPGEEVVLAVHRVKVIILAICGVRRILVPCIVRDWLSRVHGCCGALYGDSPYHAHQGVVEAHVAPRRKSPGTS
jgi:hypothetical protein